MNKYQKIEKDLRKYKGLKVFIINAKEQIKLLKQDIQGATGISYDEIPAKTNNFHSVVETEVMNRDERVQTLEKKIMHAQELVNRVDRSLKVLNDFETEVLTLKYMDNQPWFIIAGEVGMSERQCKRKRTEAIKRLYAPFFGEGGKL